MEEGKTSLNETVKEQSRYLRGRIKEELTEDTTHFNKEDILLLKFHGSYQQDDRDLRPQLMKEKKEKAFSMMVRSKIPGGRMTAEQYLVHDDLAARYGNNTLRITTRQGFQFHGVLKKNLKAVIRGINESLLTTSGACGDIVRNVTASTVPVRNRSQLRTYEYAKTLSDMFLSKSGAYHEIWLDGEKVSEINPVLKEDPEPIFGRFYLPRKFKIAVAYPDDNNVDVYTNDLGFVPEVDEKGELTGFNVLVGGGLGMTHGIAKTYPRLATPFCFVEPDEIFEIAKAIVLVQRDFGNREDRKRARLKYTIDDHGLEWFRAEVEKRYGKKTQPVHEIRLTKVDNYLGWHQQLDGRWFYGLFVENGRIKDEGIFKLKTALRTAVEKFKPEIYLSGQQDIILSGFSDAQKGELEALLKSHGIRLSEEISNVRRDALACPALPTCGLAIAESERIMPSVMDDLEKLTQELDLTGEKFLIRMTGCPNGCARPYNAEIAFVGRGIGTYNVYVGGNQIGDRMAELLAEKIPQKDLALTLRPLLAEYKKNRLAGEGFGDFAFRTGIPQLKNLIASPAA